MDKLKNVLSGHKKSEDASHDAHASSTASHPTGLHSTEAHHDGQGHPIYDQMTGKGDLSTSGTTSTTHQTGPSTGTAQTEQIGTHSGVAGDSLRPSANPTGAGHTHDAISQASIKSGVIGFGSSERQEHAALPSRSVGTENTHNPELELDRNQIVGGGNTGSGPTTADTSSQPSALKQALPVSSSAPHDQSHSNVGNTGALGDTTHSSTTQQPIRQQSYTTDTDRSFPLAGGVASKHDPSAKHPTEHHTSSTHPTEHGTTTTHPIKHDTTTTHYPAQQSSSARDPVTTDREPGTKEREIHAREGHGREGLAGAAAAATTVGVASHSHQKDAQPLGHDTRQGTHADQPFASSATGTTGNPTGNIAGNTTGHTTGLPTGNTTNTASAIPTTHNTSTTSGIPAGNTTAIPTGSTTSHTADHATRDSHPEALAAATAAVAKSSGGAPHTYDQGTGAQAGAFGNPTHVPDTGASSTQPHGTGILAGDRPVGERSTSHRHVPGAFPLATPDESSTYLCYRDDLVPYPGAEERLGADTTATSGSQLGQHEQSHPTGSGSHAPLAAGVGAGSGLAGASSHHNDGINAGKSTAGPHQSNLLNKADPRVDSDRDGSSTIKGGPSTQHGSNLTTGEPIASSTSTGVPSGQHELRHTGSLEQPRSRPADASDDHHYGRDAAIAGGIGAGAAGLGYAAGQKRDTSNVGGNTLPQEASPYSSTKLDPRVLGSKAGPEEQKYDPSTQHALQPTERGIPTSTHAHRDERSTTVAGVSSTTHGHHDHSADKDKDKSTTGPHKSSLLNKLDPRVHSDSSKTTDSSSTAVKKDDPQQHHSRDAALVGGGAGLATAGALHGNKSRADETANTTGLTGGPTPTTHEQTLQHPSHDVPISGTGTSTTGGLHKDGLSSNQSSYPTGAASTSTTTKADPQHHHGRDTALVGGGAGLATAGALHGDPSRPTETARNDDLTGAHGATKTDPQHHYGRDAALVGGGATAAAGTRQALQRNDTPGAGTAILPEQQSSSTTGPVSSSKTAHPQQASNTSAPLSSSTTDPHHTPTTAASHHTSTTTDPHHTSTTAAPHHTSSTAAPLSQSNTAASQSSSTGAPLSTAKADGPTNPAPLGSKSTYDIYTGPKTVDGTPFYGAAGAPAPLADTKHQPASDTSTTAPTSKAQDQHHHGRDAALAGAGAGTAGGLAYASQHDKKEETGPASKTVGPHSSNIANILDPRVKPDPAKQKDHTTTGPHQSDTFNRLDPKVDEKAGHKDQHHYGRDAAVVGGAGTAGYGAHEAAQAYGDHRSTQPGASMNEQRYDPTATGAHAPNPVPKSGHYDYNTDSTSHNAALGSGAALGAGALGGAAYAGSKHGDTAQQVPSSSAHPLSSSTDPTHDTVGHSAHAPIGAPATHPTSGTIAPQNTHSDVHDPSHGRYDSTQVPHGKDYSNRDAALLGTAGAAAAGGGAYAYSQHQDAEREKAFEKEQRKLQEKEQHEREKEQHKLDKEHAKQEKEAHKLEKEEHKHEKEQQKHEKAVAAQHKAQLKEDKEHEKEAHKLEKEREKEAQRLEKEREKEAEAAEPKEKKHGILGFLHRDKTKKEKRSADSSPRQSAEVRRSTDNQRHSKEYAAGGAALGAGTTAAAYEHAEDDPNSPRWKGKNLLHKDPPKGHPAREALDQHEMGEISSGQKENVGVDRPFGDSNAPLGYDQTRTGVAGSQPLHGGRENEKVIEPHTGLPMNVGRYGDGQGGTDANPAIGGHHHVPGTAQQPGAGHGATDWEAVKKADTPY